MEKKEKKLTKQQILFKIENEEDFVFRKKYNFSLKEMLESNPEGYSDKQIAQALLLTEDELKAMYQNLIEKLQVEMGVNGKKI